MLIDKKPVKEALFGSDSITFLIAAIVVELIIFYFTRAKKEKA